MADKPTIAFVETSLTDGSFEADLAKEIMGIVGDRAEAITIDYEDLPLAGEDPEYPLPEAALAVRDKLGNADAVWVVVSEYKKEIPDSLRNLFDWLSLPSTKDEEGKNVLDQKPVAISGVGGFEELHCATCSTGCRCRPRRMKKARTSSTRSRSRFPVSAVSRSCTRASWSAICWRTPACASSRSRSVCPCRTRPSRPATGR